MDWRADSLQAVAFTMPGSTQPDALKIWGALTGGASPDSFQRPTGAPNAITAAQGTLGVDRVNVTSQLGRVDIFIQADPSVVDGAPPRIPDPIGAGGRLTDYLLRSVKSIPTFRLALTTSLSVLLDEAADVAQLMTEMTGVPFPASASDLSYQYNVQKAFVAAPSIKMNRLKIWASGYHQLFTMGVNQGGVGTPASMPLQIQSIPMINFRYDANSATEFGTVIGEQAPPLIHELEQELVSILAAGPEEAA